MTWKKWNNSTFILLIHFPLRSIIFKHHKIVCSWLRGSWRPRNEEKIMEYSFNKLKVSWSRAVRSLWIWIGLRSQNHGVPYLINNVTSNHNYYVPIIILSTRVLSNLLLTTTLVVCGNFVSSILAIRILSHRELNWPKITYKPNGGTRIRTQVLWCQYSHA